MDIQTIAAKNNLRYHFPVAIVERELEEMGKVKQTPIHIYPIYPYGWEGVVGVDDRLYIFQYDAGLLNLEIEPVYGFYPNGLPRRKKYGKS